MPGGVHEKVRKNMKIVIERKQANIMVDVVAPEGVQRSDIAETLSFALASTVASTIPQNTPAPLRNVLALSLADEVAKAVKQNFPDTVSGKAGNAISFTDKEADFMRGVFNL